MNDWERVLRIQDFQSGKHPVLVATGEMANKLFVNASLVINYDVPVDIYNYIKRFVKNFSDHVYAS